MSCSYFQQNSALLDNTLCQHWDNTTPEEPPLTFMPHCHCLKAPAEQAGLKLRADSECPHVSFKVFTGCMERRRGKKSKLSIITWKCKISDIFLLLCNIWCDVQMSWALDKELSAAGCGFVTVFWLVALLLLNRENYLAIVLWKEPCLSTLADCMHFNGLSKKK